MTENENSVKSTSVAITLNAKSIGIDAFIKLEETREFSTPISNVDALVVREDLAALLTEQLLAIAKDAAGTVKAYIADNNLTPAPAPSLASGSGAGAIRAVANGASSDSDWKVAVDAFDSAKQVRYLSTNAFSNDQLKQAAAAWIETQGFSGAAFDIWDERRDAEQGKPISSICNVKLKEEYRSQAPSELIFTEKGGVKALARAKFNSDGSLFFYWANKEVTAAVKYGALNFLSNK